MRFLEAVFGIAVAFVSYSYFSKVDKESIRGKKILVAGASQNIGEEIAYQYAELGAEIIITARRQSALEKVVKRCKELGAKKADYVVADMSDTGVYESVISDAVKKLGGLDILVLNHVLSEHERWNGSQKNLIFLEKSIPVNYLSYVRLATSAMPHLKSSKGQLIIVSSQAGRMGIPNIAAYGATKAAINNFFSALQLEQMRYREAYPSITICILGAIDTENARWVLAEERIQIQGYAVSDTASTIIDGGIARQRYAYAPPYLRLVNLAREFSPDLFDRILLYVLYGHK